MSVLQKIPSGLSASLAYLFSSKHFPFCFVPIVHGLEYLMTIVLTLATLCVAEVGSVGFSSVPIINRCHLERALRLQVSWHRLLPLLPDG